MDFLETCRSKLGSKVDQYKQMVAENDVDGEVLADMSDEQLQRQARRHPPAPAALFAMPCALLRLRMGAARGRRPHPPTPSSPCGAFARGRAIRPRSDPPSPPPPLIRSPPSPPL